MSTPSIQQLIADSLLQNFSDVIIKKIDTDNYLDIHVPSIHPKKGTHIFFNTSKQKIKIGFYCREEEFVQLALAKGGGLLEEYAQGIRLKGNPEFADVETAIAATLKFMEVLIQKSTPSGGARQQKTETYTFKKAIDAYLKGNLAYVADFVQDGNPVLQFNGKILITNELISYVSAFAKLDQRIVDLVKSGVDLDASFDNGEGYTAVHFAAWDGKDKILAYLLQAGAKADLVGEDGYTPLLLAVAGGHQACVELLVEKGADVNIRVKDSNIYFSKQGGTPLTVSFINGYLETALYLIEQGADPLVLAEPCKNAPSPNLFVNFLSLVKQGQVSAPAEGQLSKILSLVGLDIDENLVVEDSTSADTQDSGVPLDLNEFLKELDGSAEEEATTPEDLDEKEEINLYELIEKFVEQQGTDNILDLLDQDYSQKGDIVVVKIDADDLIKTLSTNEQFGDFVYISGIISFKSDTLWADLSELIGKSEINWIQTLVELENPDTMVLLYCEGNYVYAFSNIISQNENADGEDLSAEEAGENKGLSDLTNFLAELEAVTSEEESIDDESDEEEEEGEEDDEEDDEEEEGGFPMISYRKPAEEMVEVVQQYLRHWQKSSQVYAWRMGIKAFIPEFVSALVSDKVCPIFTTKDIEAICSRIKSEKIIPILGYVPEEFYGYTKHVWWLVPFCIWKEDTASFVFIDKNGFYGMYSQDGEEEIDTIFNWDSVYELDFEYAYDGDPNINRLTLTQEDGNFLTFDEFVSTSEEDDHGSYLAVIEAIWEARRETIEASKGEPFWAEGAGGEGFVEFETPQDLLKAGNWDNADRPDPSMFGG